MSNNCPTSLIALARGSLARTILSQQSQWSRSSHCMHKEITCTYHFVPTVPMVPIVPLHAQGDHLHVPFCPNSPNGPDCPIACTRRSLARTILSQQSQWSRLSHCMHKEITCTYSFVPTVPMVPKVPLFLLHSLQENSSISRNSDTTPPEKSEFLFITPVRQFIARGSRGPIYRAR